MFRRSDQGVTLNMSALEAFYGDQFTLSTQLIKLNYLVISLPTHQESTTVSSETYPLYLFVSTLGFSSAIKNLHLKFCFICVSTLNIRMHILHTVHHTFLQVLTRRICLITRAALLSDYFLYPYPMALTL